MRGMNGGVKYLVLHGGVIGNRLNVPSYSGGFDD